MARQPSAETELRHYKSRLKEAERTLRASVAERTAYRARATQAEQEVAEWKRRFDALLKILPPKEAEHG